VHNDRIAGSGDSWCRRSSALPATLESCIKEYATKSNAELPGWIRLHAALALALLSSLSGQISKSATPKRLPISILNIAMMVMQLIAMRAAA
jgi:hypothetical protein